MNITNCSDFSYLSTTIPYVNAEPHVGFALELVQADALARFQRLVGATVRTSTGSDDHSLKNVRAAVARGEPVHSLVKRNSAAFEELAQALDAPFDDFLATSQDERHRPSVERLFRACADAGDLYRRSYEGLYCVGCEQFYSPAELCDGKCREHETPAELVAEENWFFRLSRYQEPLRRAIFDGSLRILPEQRRNEVLAFIDGGLADFSVSRAARRARGFGVEVPGDPSQVVFVWFDALANYLSVGGYGRLGRDCDWQRAARRQQLLGKGVLRFHAVYWPALLLSAGLRLPDELRVHGYLTVEGKKIGKSAGNAIDPRTLVEAYGADALRYYLLAHIPPFKDADFSRERLIAAHDDELADELGNLALRVLTLIHRHDLRAPSELRLGECEQPLEALASALLDNLERAFSQHTLDSALGSVWELVRATNRYLDRTEPWRLARNATASNLTELGNVLGVALAALRVIAHTLQPFVPRLSARLLHVTGSEAPCSALRDTSLRAHTLGNELPRDPASLTPLVPRIRARER